MLVIGPLRDQGKSLRAIAAELTSCGIHTRRDDAWTAAAFSAVRARNDQRVA